jgi:hypothetical protein
MIGKMLKSFVACPVFFYSGGIGKEECVCSIIKT